MKNNRKNTSKSNMNKKANRLHSRRLLYGTLIVLLAVIVAVIVRTVSKSNRGSDQIPVFRVGEETVFLDEVNLYLLQNVVNAGVTKDTLDQAMQTGEKTEEEYINDVFRAIMDLKVENIVAAEKGISLTEDEKENIEKKAFDYIGSVDGHILYKFGITQELVAKTYTEQYLAKKLEDSVTEDIDVEEQRYCTIYKLYFPKVEMDENGDYVRAEDGKTPVMLSDDTIAEVKKNAEDAYEKILAGEDIAEIAKEYQVDMYSGEESNLTNSFEETFIPYVQTLKEGECSPIIELSSCYLIVKMMEWNNEEIANQILGYYRDDLEKEAAGEKKTEWYDEMGISQNPDFVGNAWKEISLYDYVQDVEE